MAVEEITTISPSTNRPIITRYGLSQDSLNELVVSAQAAFKSYKNSHPTLISRQDVVAKALTAIRSEQEELAKELTEQMGRPIAVRCSSCPFSLRPVDLENAVVAL